MRSTEPVLRAWRGMLAWYLPDGRILPVPAGGAPRGNDDDSDDDDSDDGDEGDSDDDDDGDPDDDGKDGNDGKGESESDVAKLKAALRKERKARKAAERQASAAKPKGDKKTSTHDDKDDVVERLEQARTEERAKAQARIVRSEVRAAAAGRFADPADAALYLANDLEDLVGDDGEPDDDAITEALDELLERKPHLAAAKSSGRKSGGDSDQGARAGRKASVADRAKARADRLNKLPVH